LTFFKTCPALLPYSIVKEQQGKKIVQIIKSLYTICKKVKRGKQGRQGEGRPLATLGATKKEAFGVTGKVETPRCRSGRHERGRSGRHEKGGFWATKKEARGNKKRGLGVTKGGRSGRQKGKVVGATHGTPWGEA